MPQLVYIYFEFDFSTAVHHDGVLLRGYLSSCLINHIYIFDFLLYVKLMITTVTVTTNCRPADESDWESDDTGAHTPTQRHPFVRRSVSPVSPRGCSSFAPNCTSRLCSFRAAQSHPSTAKSRLRYHLVRPDFFLLSAWRAVPVSQPGRCRPRQSRNSKYLLPLVGMTYWAGGVFICHFVGRDRGRRLILTYTLLSTSTCALRKSLLLIISLVRASCLV